MNEMESVDCALKQMGENVSTLQAFEVPGLANWGQDKLTECQSRWDSLSKQVRRLSSQRTHQIIVKQKPLICKHPSCFLIMYVIENSTSQWCRIT